MARWGVDSFIETIYCRVKDTLGAVYVKVSLLSLCLNLLDCRLPGYSGFIISSFNDHDGVN